MEDILYIALVLDEPSKIKLLKGVKYMTNDGEDMTSDTKIYCDHMTVAFKTDITDEILQYAKENEGKKFFLETTKVGMSDKAAALEVRTPVRSVNAVKHITLYTYNGGKPKDSNDIPNWMKLKDKSILHQRLSGTLQIIYKR